MKKAETKGYKLYESIDMKCSENANVERQTVDY